MEVLIQNEQQEELLIVANICTNKYNQYDFNNWRKECHKYKP